MGKKTSEILNAHAKKRAEERYGVKLNHEDRRQIVNMIQNKEAEYIGKQSNNRTFWRVNYQDKSLNVVYDKARSAMCTVLPPDAPEFTMSVPNEKHDERKSRYDKITAELSEIWKDE